MAEPQLSPTGRLDQLLAARPDIAVMAPFLAYLLLLGVRDLLPYEWRAAASAIRGLGTLVVILAVRRHLPPWGKPCWLIAVPAGLVVAWGWVYGQHLFNDWGVPHRIPLVIFPGQPEIIDPRDQLGVRHLYWTTIAARIAVATTIVPIVEEFFWRGFLLRAMINWARFEKVPLGTFTWLSFLGTSLLSTLEHPDNWAVSIPCWFAYNGLMYWKKSILCLIIAHGVTNLALYVYVVGYGDWMFW